MPRRSTPTSSTRARGTRPRSRAETRTPRRTRREEAAAMTDTTTLERLLLGDLDVEGERARDEKFCTELYRALTRQVWRNDRDAEGQLSPSFQRAEWLVNEWRARHGYDALTLALTGGEGEVAGTVDDVLGRLGWTHKPLPTDRDHPAHLRLDPPPPPAPPRPRPVAPAARPRRADGAGAAVGRAGARRARGRGRRAGEEGGMTTDREGTAAVAAQSGAGEDEARAGFAATLEALGARLAGGSVDELADALPADAADALRRGRTPAPEQGSLT